MNWYQQSPSDALASLNAYEQGLSVTEISERLALYGHNVLPQAKPPGIAALFLKQFQSPLIYILLAASVIIFLMNEPVDGLIILFVLLLNAVIGSFQEGKAQDTLAALRTFTHTDALVVRGGQEMIVSDEELVPGDIVLLKEGDKVPADCRIIEFRALTIDESALTGESEPVQKRSELLPPIEAPIAEQKNMLFKGTYVLSGTAKALVVTTGVRTVIGAISVKLASIDTEVPLKKNIDLLSRAIIVVVLMVSAFIFVIGMSAGNGAREMFATVVAIAVSAIPEGLPVVVTLILATSVARMSKRHALVKRLQAVEALGQAKIIAVDKTGTVTKNQMMASRLYVHDSFFDITGSGYDPAGDFAVGNDIIEPLEHPQLLLCGKIALFSSDAVVVYSKEHEEWQRLSGDPTEAALLTLGRKMGFHPDELLRENPRVAEIPFDSSIKYHASVHETNGKNTAFVAGAWEVIMERSESFWQSGRHIAFTNNTDKEKWRMAVREMSQEGLRVIALAISSQPLREVTAGDLPSLCLVGLVGISDVIRPEVHDAVAKAKEAGIRVVMITGDYAETAKAIAKKAHIFEEGDRVLSGSDLSHMSSREALLAFDNVSVFARVTPDDKLKIIESYRSRGEIVAMTGDGVNDALSLAAADLGVAMGKNGTEVAKEAADIILLDDNFGSIVSAIEEGRNIYNTIRKVVLYLFSTGAGEILAIIGAILFGLPIPVLAGQIIWLNLVTDGVLVAALALEPKEKGLLGARYVHPSKWIIDGKMLITMILVAVTMAVGSLLLFNAYLSAGFLKASTMALTVLAVFQWLNAWNCRSDRNSVFSRSLVENKFLFAGTLIVIGLQLLAVYVPFMQKVLRTTALSGMDWLIIVVISLSIILVDEVRKAFYRLSM